MLNYIYNLKHFVFIYIYIHFSGIQIVIHWQWADLTWTLSVVEVGCSSIPLEDEDSKIQEWAFQVACQGNVFFFI
jgi:hypothetical protein